MVGYVKLVSVVATKVTLLLMNSVYVSCEPYIPLQVMWEEEVWVIFRSDAILLLLTFSWESYLRVKSDLITK